MKIEKKKAKRKNRAIALGLANALGMMEQFHRQGGGNEVPRTALGPILDSSVTSSLFDRKIAALRSYGLIDVHGDMISLTSLGKSYATPTSSENKQRVTLQAFRNVPLFENLLSRYNGKPLPVVDEYFFNLVADTYDLDHEEAPIWVKRFINGAKFAGVLVSEGGEEIIRLSISVGAPSSQPQGGAPTMEMEEVQEQSGEALSLMIHGAKTRMNFPDKIDEKMLEEAIGATEDYLEVLRRKLTRLTGKEYAPVMTVYVPKGKQH